jgi:ankyrin repeat protein
MLVTAADLGHEGACGIVGWLHGSFGKEMPPGSETTILALHPSITGRSTTIRRRLRQLGSTERFEIDTSSGYYPGRNYGRLESTARIAALLRQGIFLEQRTTPLESVKLLLWKVACNGSSDLLRLLPPHQLPEVNCVDSDGNSVLLMASRYGHREAVIRLLHYGADASIANKRGATALHYLSAFSEEDVAPVANALVAGKRSLLEARAKSRSTPIVDPIHPMPGGTPLTWAVAADNPAAVSALVELGADPFDEASHDAPTSDRWTEWNLLPPVFIAAARHQYHMLKALFPADRRATFPNLGEKLNSVRVKLGSQGGLETVNLFSICARYDMEGLLPRLLLHGCDYQVAFQKTFETLIELGADPLATPHRGAAIIGFAVHGGQPFAVEYLMRWRDGALREWPRVWYEMTVRAARDSDRVIFDTLMKYEAADQFPPDEWGRYLSTIARESQVDDTYFLEPFRDKIQRAGDLGPHLSVAINAGNFELARWIHRTASICDVMQPVDDKSLLGRILLLSKQFHTLQAALRTLLLLPGVPEQVFEDVMEIGGSRLTALHAAALHFEYHPESSMAGRVFEEVQNVFFEPRHLNFQLEGGLYAGYSPLHFAIRFGNVEAVRLLLEEVDEGLDINLVNGNGETAFDRVLCQFSSQEQWFDLMEVRPESRPRLGVRHWDQTLDVLGMVQRKGGRPRKFLMVVLRPSEYEYAVVDLRRNQPIYRITGELAEGGAFSCRTPANRNRCNMTGGPDAILRNARDGNPFFAAMARLSVRDCFLMADPRYDTGDEQQNGEAVVYFPPLLPTEGPELTREEMQDRTLEMLRARGMQEPAEGQRGA